MTEMKDTLYSDLARGNINIRDATRTMRKIIGMTQAEYAKKVVKISPRILSDFERGIGNPTLETLEKIGKPFGLKVSFLPPEAWRLDRPGATNVR
jgi:transcriptional regulator with XRE-family HTH domain